MAIILQAKPAWKPKYSREILRQLYIFDTLSANTILQKTYLANA